MVELETDRLRLRPLEGRDADALCDLMADPELAAFLTPEGAPRPRAEEWRAAASYIGHWAIRGFGFFAVEEKQTGAFVGRVGPWMPEGWPALECGWAIASSYWGRGYAPEAAVATIRWVFDRYPDLPRIISVIDPENANSQRVAGKIGERRTDEIFEFWGHRLEVWAASREEWFAQFD